MVLSWRSFNFLVLSWRLCFWQCFHIHKEKNGFKGNGSEKFSVACFTYLGWLIAKASLQASTRSRFIQINKQSLVTFFSVSLAVSEIKSCAWTNKNFDHVVVLKKVEANLKVSTKNKIKIQNCLPSLSIAQSQIGWISLIK